MFDPANFFGGLLRSNIIFPDIKDHVLNKLEGVIQHQLFQFPVVTPAPIISREKRPPNFNLGFFRVVTIEPGRSDDLLILSVDDHERPAGFQCLAEEDSENIFLVTIALRMLFPDERFGRDGKKIVPIFQRQRAKLDEFTF